MLRPTGMWLVLLLLASALCAACKRQGPQVEAVGPPPAAVAAKSPPAAPVLFDTQRAALDKAGVVPSQVQQAADQREKAIAEGSR